MSLDNSTHELGDLGNMKDYETRVEALQRRDDRDRDDLVRLGKKPVLKVQYNLDLLSHHTTC